MSEKTHRIKLNTDVQPMFFLPNKFHLTWENPGPVDIDILQFSEQEKNWLNNAKLKKVLLVENLLTNKEVIQQDKRPVSKKDNQASSADIEQIRAQRIADAKKTLTAPLPALKRFLEKSGDIAQIRLLKEQESLGKNRDKTLKLINDRLNQLMLSVSNLVGPPVESVKLPKDKFVSGVEEILEDTVTIQTGSED
jgi:hypothetical protein